MDPRTDTPRHILEPATPAGRQLRMVSRDWLLRSVSAAVERTLLEFSGLSPAARQTLRREIQRRFVALTLDRARRVRGLTRAEVLRDFERAHAALLADHAETRRELEEIETRLEASRQAPPAPAEPSGPGALDRSLEADLEELLRAADPRAALARVLEREALRRDQAVEGALAAERGKVDLLERRVAKMRGELAGLERSLAELEQRAATDEGVASIYKTVQGLSASEAQRELKRDLMRQIFEANVGLQRHAGERAPR
jgi:hypothetical protein